MARQTSVEAYRYVQDSGVLGQRQFEVYDVLYRFGPLTANEAFNIIAKEKRRPNFDSNTRARFTELREMGAIVEVGERVCSVTGMTVILWDVTDRIPVKPEKKPSRTEIKIRKAVLEERIRCMRIALMTGWIDGEKIAQAIEEQTKQEEQEK